MVVCGCAFTNVATNPLGHLLWDSRECYFTASRVTPAMCRMQLHRGRHHTDPHINCTVVYMFAGRNPHTGTGTHTHTHTHSPTRSLACTRHTSDRALHIAMHKAGPVSERSIAACTPHAPHTPHHTHTHTVRTTHHTTHRTTPHTHHQATHTVHTPHTSHQATHRSQHTYHT